MSDRGNYSTRTVIEHMYEVSSDPSGDSSNLTKWAKMVCEKLGRPYSVREIDFEMDSEGRFVAIIREVAE